MTRVLHRRKLRAQITRLKAHIRRDELAIAQIERHAPDNPLFQHTSRAALIAVIDARQQRQQERLLLLEAQLIAFDAAHESETN
ncbi:hypothetical protein [Herpetosiphon llansteffanensis]|uniref:hypothetical protein n=1 Tax=Herpetosiphon llansteffanensis TaxID=2094568 RepID=UPI000D7CC216|nr:hypothetical protein [Herpetosiphon llansteffanensis]